MRRYNSLRAALSVEGRDDTIHINGLPGYSLMHAYTLLLPASCYAAKVLNGRRKFVALVALAFLAFVVYDTFVTTSLLLMVATLLVTILYNDKYSSLYAFVFFFLLIIVYILYQVGVFISLVDWIMPIFEGTPVEEKLIDFRYSMVNNRIMGSTITTRQSLHAVSWQSFMYNPLIGTGNAGKHSALLDRLGGMGLFAFVPFLMMIVSALKSIKNSISTKESKVFFLLGVIVGFAFLYTKGLWESESWLLFLILMPMTIIEIEKTYVR